MVTDGKADDVSLGDGESDDDTVSAGVPVTDVVAVSVLERVLAVVAAGGVPSGLAPVLRVADALPLFEADAVGDPLDDPLEDPLDVAEDDPLAVLDVEPLAVFEDDPLEDPLEDPLADPLVDADDVDVKTETDDAWAANVVLAVAVGE